MDRTWFLFTKAASSRDSRIRLEIVDSQREQQGAQNAPATAPAIECDDASLCSCHAGSHAQA